MSEISTRKLYTGKSLLAVVFLLSLNLVLQLFSVADTLDLTGEVTLSWIGITMATSYTLTAICMILLIQEFFQIKIKIKNLLALTTPKKQLPISPKLLQTQPTDQEEDPNLDGEASEDKEFDELINEEIPEPDKVDEAPLSKYKTTIIKIDDEIDEDSEKFDEGLLDLMEEAELAPEDEEHIAKLVENSEIIQTLNELEVLVNEMKQRRNETVS